LHGQLHQFYLRIQHADPTVAEAERLDQLISAIRNSMYAAKNIKDAQYDISQMRNSSNDIKYDFYKGSAERVLNFYKHVLALLDKNTTATCFEDLTSLYQSITSDYPATLHLLYKDNLVNRVSETEISTLINFNRELYTSYKSILFGLKDYLLNPTEAEYFDSLPGFIR